MMKMMNLRGVKQILTSFGMLVNDWGKLRREVSYTSFEPFCLQIFADYVLHDMMPANLELVSNSTASELPTQPTFLAFFLLLLGGALRLANPSYILF